MGAVKSKYKTQIQKIQKYKNKHSCKCTHPLKLHYNHCCIHECFFDDNMGKMIDLLHLKWYCNELHEKELENILIDNSISFSIQIILMYLPNIRDTRKICNDIGDYHVYFHPFLSIYNNGRIPCSIWFKYSLKSEIKMLILGGNNVGKTEIIKKYFNNEYNKHNIYKKRILINVNSDDWDLNSTDISVDTFNQYNIAYHSISLNIFDGNLYNFDLKLDEYMKTSNVYLVIFSVISQNSFHEAIQLINKIIQIKNNNNNSDYCIMLCGNKIDLRLRNQLLNDDNDNITVLSRDAINIAKKYNIPYIETSVVENKNINFMFRQSIYELWFQSNYNKYTLKNT